MTSNHENSRDWLRLAFLNIDRALRNYKINDFAACVFRIQLSIEQLQKALVFLFGMQFRKTHEPSEILSSIEPDKNAQIDDKIRVQVEKITKLAKNIEDEGTATRYGIIEKNKLISTPEDRFKKPEAENYLNDLKEILMALHKTLENLPNFEKELEKLSYYTKELEDLEL